MYELTENRRKGPKDVVKVLSTPTDTEINKSPANSIINQLIVHLVEEEMKVQ